MNLTPWDVKVDLALPCATQNELKKEDAKLLLKINVLLLLRERICHAVLRLYLYLQRIRLFFHQAKLPMLEVLPSGLEMSQNSLRYNWTRKEVDEKLHNIMLDIHQQCVEFGSKKMAILIM